MRILSRLTGGVAAAALLLSAAGPAAARDGRWDGPRRHHHHHDRGPSAGTVIGAIAAFGLLAAIASSASKKKDVEKRAAAEASAADERAAAPYPDDADARYDGRRDGAPRYDDARADSASRDAAVDGCVVAARSQASRGGDYAEIRGVNGVSAREGGWDVSGQVEQRASYSATDGWQRNFRCLWQDGRVSTVSLD
jgi:hypothetical protein